MKTRFTTALLATAALGLSAGHVFAQAPAAAAPLTQSQPLFDYNQLPAIHGTVKFFTLTPRGDVDGFVLADGTQVHLPPHLSSQLVAAVRLGDAVTVHGLKAAAIPMVDAMAVTGDASHQTVVDMGPHGGPEHGHGPRPPHGPPPPPPGAGPASDVSGKVMVLLHGPRGEANGAMLEDGTVLRMPPPEATRLAALLAPGQTVAAEGHGMANNLGRVLEVRAIGPSADQLPPLARPPHGPRGEHRGPPPGGPDAPPPRP